MGERVGRARLLHCEDVDDGGVKCYRCVRGRFLHTLFSVQGMIRLSLYLEREGRC